VKIGLRIEAFIHCRHLYSVLIEFEALGARRAEDFPGAMRYYERTLSLPLFPAMEDGDVDRVVESLGEVLRSVGRA
jgi:dTDP-4-amino-4,6-dideoxygalactose transaminase